MKFSNLQLALNVAIATILTGLAITLFLTVGLGSDPITVFVDGLYETLQISYGTASRFYNLILIGIAYMISRKHIGWMTIVYAFSVGFTLDFFYPILEPLQLEIQPFLVQMMLLLLAQLLLGFSFAILIVSNAGMSSNDAICYKIEEITKLPFMIIRTTMDVFLVVLGFCMGGVIGIGTLLSMLTTGYFIQFFLTHFERINSRIEYKKILL